MTNWLETPTRFEQHVATLPECKALYKNGQLPCTVLDTVSVHSTPEFDQAIKAFTAGDHNYQADARRDYGYAVLTASAVEALREYAPFIELGCGAGYWAWELDRRGVEIVATDPHPLSSGQYPPLTLAQYWTEVEQLDAVDAVQRYPRHTPLLVWPSYHHPWAFDALQACVAEHLVYVGEGDGGCTATDDFHDLLGQEWDELACLKVPQWNGLHDQLYVYRRKEQSEVAV